MISPHPDGWSTGMHIGFIVPHADIGPEAEAQTLLAGQATVHGGRVHFAAMRAGGEMDDKIAHQPVTDFTQPPHIDEAVAALAQSPLHAIALAFTSSSYKHGADAERALLDRLAPHARGIPLNTTCTAATAALRTLAAKTVAIYNPPWFDEGLNELGATYFTAAGFAVGHRSAVELPSRQLAITPEGLHDYVTRTVGDEDAIFVAGNGQRAIGAIEALERTIGRPVLTANQVLTWKSLTDAGRDLHAPAYGRLLTRHT
ncbi:hypothetical protein [Nocardia sp. BMG111209]|uniref:maleate cis-trans isomerase family protein n=1 Tax=Nocardia sp. BMG111209 TaxID=1160137 RepID=UPI000360EA27|nr:hypothetical protein [Nocardia sp. BMG111209]